MNFIYCRGGDKNAPSIAEQAGMLYGIRYDYKAYAPVYMLDCGLSPRWAQYKKVVARLRPTIALVPDFETYRDIVQINLYIQDLRDMQIPLIGIAPKFYGALSQIDIADDIVICESIPTQYSGYLLADDEIVSAKYHLLGGDIRAQIAEKNRIEQLGGRVVSMDGNKLAMKAAHGQVYVSGRWIPVKQDTKQNALQSAINIMNEIRE